jgi:hypothetical protein|nr:MAG TPA: hypothetical protein [Bacteriophage sp.]
MYLSREFEGGKIFYTIFKILPAPKPEVNQKRNQKQ